MLIWKRRAIIMEILGFMFGRCVVFGINPIGMGYFLCMYGHEVNKGLMGIMILLGMATVMEKVEVIKYALVMGTVSVIINLLRHSGKKIIPKSVYITGGIVTMVLSLSKGIFTVDYKSLSSGSNNQMIMDNFTKYLHEWDVVKFVVGTREDLV